MMFIGFDPSPQLIKSTCGETSEREPSERPGDDIDIRMTNLGNQILNGIFQNVCRGHTTHSHALHPFLLFFLWICLEIRNGEFTCKKLGLNPRDPQGIEPISWQACLRTTNWPAASSSLLPCNVMLGRSAPLNGLCFSGRLRFGDGIEPKLPLFSTFYSFLLFKLETLNC